MWYPFLMLWKPALPMHDTQSWKSCCPGGRLNFVLCHMISKPLHDRRNAQAETQSRNRYAPGVCHPFDAYFAKERKVTYEDRDHI